MLLRGSTRYNFHRPMSPSMVYVCLQEREQLAEKLQEVREENVSLQLQHSHIETDDRGRGLRSYSSVEVLQHLNCK